MEIEKEISYLREDYGYYDRNGVELQSILSCLAFRPSDTLLDIGAGIGRLSIPLSKYMMITALEPNRVLLDEIVDGGGVEKVHGKIQDYFPAKKFDYALIAWPQFEEEYCAIFKHLCECVLKDGGRLIVLKSRHHALRELTASLFPAHVSKGKKFIESLPEHFEVERTEAIETQHIYPSLDKAVELLRFEIEWFYERSISKEQKEYIFKYLKKHQSESGEVVLIAHVTLQLCRAKRHVNVQSLDTDGGFARMVRQGRVISQANAA